MSRLAEVNSIAIDTLTTMAGELDAVSDAVAMLPKHDLRITLDEIGERRAAITSKIGETRREIARLIETLKTAKEG